MEKNKTGKYLKYAIGEIILVVLGILIALQINNWNELKKMNQKEITILQGLKDDLIIDLESFNISIERLRMREKFTIEVLALLNNPIPKTIDSIEISRKLLTIGWIENFSPSFATYDEIKGSGGLSILKSGTIKLELANYKSTIDYSNTISYNWNEDIKDYERIIISHFEGDISQQNLMRSAPLSNKNLKFDLKKISEDNELVKLLMYISYLTKMEINGKKQVIIPNIELIIALIEKEITKS